MDNGFNEDIDGVFHQRFEGLKDHSVHPSSQWGALESELNFVSSLASGSNAVASSGFSILNFAASMVGIVMLTTIATQDESTFKSSYDEVSIASMKNSESGFLELRSIAGSRFGKELNASDVAKADLVSKSQDTDLVAANTSIDEAPDRLDRSTGLERNGDRDKANLAYVVGDDSQLSAENHHGIDLSDDVALMTLEEDQRKEIQLMESLVYETSALSIIDRDHEPYNPDVDRVVNNRPFYVRAGLRTGNGESNALISEGGWRLNGLLSLGYAYIINEKTFLSVEAGYLRRSGNGIERSKDVDLKPLFSVINTNYEQTTQQQEVIEQEAMKVRESVVATTMDYLHLPILVHVRLKEKSNASVGFYGDYLLSADNESYMVYNTEEYVRTNGIGQASTSNTSGLNKWRSGLMAGFEHNINEHFSFDIRAMLPITSAFDSNSDYYMHTDPNQSLDLQFALKYKI